MKDKGVISAGTVTGETVSNFADKFCCCHYLGASSEEKGGVG